MKFQVESEIMGIYILTYVSFVALLVTSTSAVFDCSNWSKNSHLP